jgi:hypothetical protein
MGQVLWSALGFSDVISKHGWQITSSRCLSTIGSCWPELNDYPDLWHLASQFEPLIGSPEMVVG